MTSFKQGVPHLRTPCTLSLYYKNSLNTLTKTAMSKTFVISDDVINTINSLPEEDRIAMSAAIAGEMICGKKNIDRKLNSMQRIILSIIRASVKRSTDAYLATGLAV